MLVLFRSSGVRSWYFLYMCILCLIFILWSWIQIELALVSDVLASKTMPIYVIQNSTLDDATNNGDAFSPALKEFVSSANVKANIISKKDIDIVIWIPPNRPADPSRLRRLKGIAQEANSNKCFNGCRMEASDKQADVDTADVVTFFMYREGYKSEELPRRPNSNQIWIYRQHEPPPYYVPKADLNGLFNWTSSYRRDSDSCAPYGDYSPLGKNLDENEAIYMRENMKLNEWVSMKEALAVAVISNCQTSSNRELILKRLQLSGISVDIYGACGTKMACDKVSKSCATFWEQLAQKYKFYMAFENSLCSHYVTEKFWRSLNMGLVPIVLGRDNYTEVAPPKSFIDLREFSGPEEFKSFLENLDNDDIEYSKYFEWRRKYMIKEVGNSLCDLCDKLKMWKVSGKRKVYNDIVKWWGNEPDVSGGPACIEPKEFGVAGFL